MSNKKPLFKFNCKICKTEFETKEYNSFLAENNYEDLIIWSKCPCCEGNVYKKI